MSTILRHITILFIFAFILLKCAIADAQTWTVPAEKKAKVSSFKFTENTIKEGEAIYTKNCVSCHGNPGKANFLKTLTPLPPDLATANTQLNTDGELFYKLSEGKAIMPSFKNILSEEERWKVIAYIRSFNKTYVQPEAAKSTDDLASRVKVVFHFDAASATIKVIAKAGLNNKDTIPLADAEAILFVKRYFGKMKIDTARRSDKQGVAVFHFPKDLPGDKAGMLDISIKITDDKYGEIEKSISLKTGVPTDVPSLTEKRALWNVVSKAPWWLLITFTAVVFIVWGFILYIIAKLFSLKKLAGKNDTL